MDKRSEELDRDYRSFVAVQFFRWLALALISSAFLGFLYGLFATDFWWLGSGPDSPLELILASLVFFFLLGTAVTLFADWRKHPGFNYMRILSVAGLLLLLGLHILLLSVMDGLQLPWVELYVLFGTLMPLISLVLLALDLASGHVRFLSGCRLTFTSAAQLKLPVLSTVAAATIIAGTWYMRALPPESFPNYVGSVFVAGNQLASFSPQTGHVEKRKWPQSQLGLESPECFRCLGWRGVVYLGGHSVPHLPVKDVRLYTYVPFDSTYSRISLPMDMEYVVSLDYHERDQTYLVCGHTEGGSCVLLLDSLLNPIKDYTHKIDVIGSEEYFTGYALFLDSSRLLVVYPEQCVVVNLADETRRELVRGEFSALSPDRQWILVSDGLKLKPRYFLVSTVDGRRTELADVQERMQGVCFSPSSEQLVYSIFTPALIDFRNRYCVYDLVSERVYKTVLCNADGALFWVPPSQ